MLPGQTFFDFDAVTSSEGLAAGSTPFTSPTGPTTSQSGPAPAPALPSRRPGRRNDARRVEAVLSRALEGLAISSASDASTPGTPTGDTSGPSSGDSSRPSDRLQSSVSRSLGRMEWSGSLEYGLHLSESDTPLGPPIFRLRASGRRTSDSGCSGWPTPKSQEDGRTLEQYEAARRRGYEARKGKTSGGPASAQGGLAIAAQLAGWGTPSARDHKDAGPAFEADPSIVPVEGRLARQAALAGWATPTANEKARSDEFRAGREPNAREALAGWATPNASDHKVGTSEKTSQPAALSRQAAMASGPDTTSSPAGTGNCGESRPRGALDPAFSLWLMGYPWRWLESGRRAMAASTRSRAGRSRGVPAC